MGEWRVRLRFSALWAWGFLLVSCLPAMASSGGNCVAFAREVTGIHLDGNAASWWPHAEGRYDRGHQPSVGAILVFKPFARMHVGHVAVVSRVLSVREILVDQANWVRGRVTRAMSVVDASPLNDWTSVKVQYAGTHGRENPTFGFIYPRVRPANFGETIVAPQHGRGRASHATDRARHPNAAHDTEKVEKRVASRTPHAAANAHHKTGHQPEKVAEPGAGNPQRVVDAHHKHKGPDAKLAYVY